MYMKSFFKKAKNSKIVNNIVQKKYRNFIIKKFFKDIKTIKKRDGGNKSKNKIIQKNN
uniref:Uncharacterized protein n=1 Tax=viral metagenome TaxID=1070528 RepID=A0A6C0F6S1_9ZZZZ